MNDLILNKNNTFIEICEMSEEDLAGRVKIKMSSHLIHPDNTQWNKNGLCWLEKYTQENIKSAIGMDYVVAWADEENQIPSGHGNMVYNSEGNLQFEGSVVVGSVQEAYITNVEIDGEEKKVMMTEGYINSQRYPLFVKWLREEIKDGKVHGSIEINGKGKSKKIEYLDGDKNEDGTKKMGRIPTKFDFSGLAILSGLEDPADDHSIVFEVNSKQNNLDINKNLGKEDKNLSFKKIKDGMEIELNELNYDDVACMITKAFNKVMDVTKDCGYYYNGYWLHKLYQSRAIMTKYDEPGSYYMVSYNISNAKVILGDIVKAEEDWKPIDGETPVEVNTEKLQEILSNSKDKEGELNMEYKEKYEAMKKDYEAAMEEKDEMKKKMDKMMEEMAEKNTKVQEFETKISELNEVVVNANKNIEELKASATKIESELNSFKEEKAKAETEAKIAEVNSYFENEIIKNGFEESEVNSLKSFVEAVDLEGLKSAEAELCAKKFKEMISKEPDVEVNSKNEMFIAIKQKEKKKIEGTIPSFFN